MVLRKRAKLKKQLTLEERFRRNLLESARSSGIAPIAWFFVILFLTGLLYAIHPFSPPLRQEVYLFGGILVLIVFSGVSITYYILAARSQKRHISGIGTMPCHTFEQIGVIESVIEVDEQTKIRKMVRPEQGIYENGGLSNWPVNTGGRWAGFVTAPKSEIEKSADLQIMRGVYVRQFYDDLPPDIQNWFEDGKAERYRWYSPVYRWVGPGKVEKGKETPHYDHVMENERLSRSLTAFKAHLRELQDYVANLKLRPSEKPPTGLQEPQQPPGETEL